MPYFFILKALKYILKQFNFVNWFFEPTLKSDVIYGLLLMQNIFFSAEAIRNNTRRFITLASEAVWDLLPDYREHEPPARDALDVYINHRTLMEARTRNPGENRPTQNAFPPELMRRFEVNFKVKLFGTLGLGYGTLD